MGLITEFAGKNDPATIACIASTANRIRQLTDKLDEVEQEIPRLEETLLQYGRPQTGPFSPRQIQPPAILTGTNDHQRSPRKSLFSQNFILLPTDLRLIFDTFSE